MADPRSVRRTLLVIGITAAVAFPAFALGSAPQETDAAWQVAKNAAVTATAVTPAQPTALTCPASGSNLSPVSFTWSAPPGPAPSGYTLRWTGTYSGSSTWTSTSGSVNYAASTIIVSVYADYGSWESAAGTQTRRVSGFIGWTCA